MEEGSSMPAFQDHSTQPLHQAAAVDQPSLVEQLAKVDGLVASLVEFLKKAPDPTRAIATLKHANANLDPRVVEAAVAHFHDITAEAKAHAEAAKPASVDAQREARVESLLAYLRNAEDVEKAK